MLPNDFPKWSLVHYYFQKWSHNGTFEEINDMPQDCLRKKRGRKRSPSIDIIDSQGVLLAVKVHAANQHDSKAAMEVISGLNW